MISAKILFVIILLPFAAPLLCHKGEKTSFAAGNYQQSNEQLTVVFCYNYCVKHFLIYHTSTYTRIYTKHSCDDSNSEKCVSNSCSRQKQDRWGDYVTSYRTSRCCCSSHYCNDDVKSVEDFDSDNHSWHNLFKGLIPGSQTKEKESKTLDSLQKCLTLTDTCAQLRSDHQTVKDDLHAERTANERLETEKQTKETELEDEKWAREQDRNTLQELIDNLKLEKVQAVETLESEKTEVEQKLNEAQHETETWKQNHQNVQNKHDELEQTLQDERSQKKTDDAQREKELQTLQEQHDNLKLEKDQTIETLNSEKDAVEQRLTESRSETEAWKDNHKLINDKHDVLEKNLQEERSQREKENEKRDTEFHLLKGRSVKAEKELEEVKRKLQELENKKDKPNAEKNCQSTQSEIQFEQLLAENSTLLEEIQKSNSSSLLLEEHHQSIPETLIYWLQHHYKIVSLCSLSIIISLILFLTRLKVRKQKFYPNYSMNQLQER